MFTPEAEVDELHIELRQARRYLEQLERAPHEHRWTGDAIAWLDACANQRQRIAVLEQQLKEACAQLVMAEGMS
jgi:hypothetical protein